MSGLTYEQIAANLKVDPSTVWRTVRKFEEDGTVEARKHKGEKTLTVYDELLIIQSVLDNPSIYLHELWCRVEETSTNVTESAICRFLHRKKLAKIVSQRSEELREKFLIDCSVYEPEMLVFVDETGCDRHSAVRRFAIPLEVCLFPLTIVCYYPDAQYTRLVKIRPHTCAISSHITFSPIKQYLS